MTGPDDEATLFRLAMQGVRTQASPNRLPPYRPPPDTRARQRELDDRAVMDELLHGDEHPESAETGETLSYRANGIQDSVFRRLKRGHYRVEAELDLHGHNKERARLALAQFLARCQSHDARCVRIIHGKGNGSPNSGPVIKRAVDGWLRRRNDVLAFCSARPQDGGSGALYLLLRSPPRGR